MVVARARATTERVARRLGPDFTTPAVAPETRAATHRIVLIGVLLTATAVLLQVAVHLINLLAFDFRFDLLNADRENTVFSWASSAFTFAAAGFSALLAGFRPRHAWLLLLLAAALAFLSLDDAIQIHERVSELRTELGPIQHFSRTFWPLAYLPLLGSVFVTLAVLARGMRREAGRLVLAGLALLAIAIVLEMASPVLFELGFDHGDLGYELEAAIEEGLELGGWMLITLGLAVTSCTLGPEPRAPAIE